MRSCRASAGAAVLGTAAGLCPAVVLARENGTITIAGGTAGTTSSPATKMLGRCLCTSVAGPELPLGCRADACWDVVLIPFPFLFPAMQQEGLSPAEPGVQLFAGAGTSGADLVASRLPAFWQHESPEAPSPWGTPS